jgi:hypothetical protein
VSMANTLEFRLGHIYPHPKRQLCLARRTYSQPLSRTIRLVCTKSLQPSKSHPPAEPLFLKHHSLFLGSLRPNCACKRTAGAGHRVS